MCGLEAALLVMGGKWKPLILFHLGPGKRRFGELRRLVSGVSEKMLIQQLRELQADGIIERADFKEIPPKVEYSVTPLGRTLAEALAPLCAWGVVHSEAIETIRLRRPPAVGAERRKAPERVSHAGEISGQRRSGARV
jgi:DNA-binding HxlR family transcriptional regulator